MKSNSKLARRRLDERLAAFADLGPPPAMGWVRAIRNAVGITAAQLAGRLAIKPSSVADLEKNEAAGKVTLATLRRAAEALDCTLVYALVPRQSLETMVEEAAGIAAERELAASLHTMALEAQGVRERDRADMLAVLADEIAEAGGRRLWGEPAR